VERPDRRQAGPEDGRRDILEEDHYGLEDVKDRVLEFLAVRKLQMERYPREEGKAD
jgi:ATP-dependent Lon protease